MRAGDHVFLVVQENNEDQTFLGYAIHEATILSDAAGDMVEVDIVNPQRVARITVPRGEIVATREDADRKLWALNTWQQKRQLAKAVKGNIQFLPEGLAALDGVYASSNPLRWGEPHIAYSAYTDTFAFDRKGNVQKVLQVLLSIYEDLSILLKILFVLSYANDYAKKLIGKYMIVELISMHECLGRLSNLDPAYKDSLYQAFLADFKDLDDRHKLLQVRQKVGAHREVSLGITQTVDYWRTITRHHILSYVKLFEVHLAEVFKLYHGEADFRLARAQRLNGIDSVEVPEGLDYEPFDEPILDEGDETVPE